MRILLVNKFFWRKGGSETVFFGEKKLLEERGHETVAFAMKHPDNLPSPHARFFVDQVDYASGSLGERLRAAGNVVYSFEARRRLELLLADERIDLAHLHVFQHQLSPSIFEPLRKRNIPIVLTLHDLKPICPNYRMLTHDGVCERCKGGRFYQCFLHRCTKRSALGSLVATVEMYVHRALRSYRHVSAYVAVSRFYREKMIEFGCSPERIAHVPNWVDAAAFALPGVDLGYGMYFGRLSEEKGLPTLMRALTQAPRLPFYIVGSGSAERDLRRSALALGLTNVVFTGHREAGELARLVAGASFSVIPSEWYENCPMSVLESFAAGKPVIGANIGGLPELIDHEVDGLVFEPGNADDLAASMLRLWSDPAQRAAMGRAARRKAVERFSPERHYRELLAVFAACLTRARGGRPGR